MPPQGAQVRKWCVEEGRLLFQVRESGRRMAQSSQERGLMRSLLDVRGG